MSYGQINYPQNLGTGPSVDTIADVGCFLTAFCNLLERFGEPVDPPTLNTYFINHGAYLPDGPNRDNLGWGSVSAYDGNVVATGTGGAGWPPSNEAIVKFNYKSKKTGNPITHFCLVVDHDAGTILDSWDGVVKHTPYGNPTGWATYARHQPQVIAPPPPVEKPAFTVEDIPHKTVRVTKNTHLWDLNQRSWPGIVNNPAAPANDGDIIATSRIAHQVLGCNYYIPDGESSLGYNVVDCQDYTAPAPEVIPEVAPTPPPAGPLQPGGNPDNKYNVVKPVPGYMTATNAGNRTNPVNEIAPGEYFVYNTHPNNAELINVTSKLGAPGSWINKGDNVVDAPPTPEPEVAPTPDPVPEPPIEPVLVDGVVPPWRDSFNPFPAPVHYIAARDIKVEDLSGQAPDMPLLRYNPGIGGSQGVVSVFGTVTKEGVDYYRLKTNNDPEFNFWYGVPKMDKTTGTANLLLQPSAGKPIGKVTVARDTIQLAKTRIADSDFLDFLDDMIPFIHKKNKNKK